jgi:hypothetical protein
VALLIAGQLVCQRPKLAVAIAINWFFHPAVFVQALTKRIISVLSL